jgi:hypothetical protein
MEQMLKRLGDFVDANPKRAYFNAPASAKDIAALEGAIGLPLPDDYKQFLSAFNGGFINVSGIEHGTKHWNAKTARWNSNHLLGTQEIKKEYKQWKTFGSEVFGMEGKWEFVPFCQTSEQELLMFGPRAAGNWPVIDAYHEMPPEEWSKLYASFEKFLAAYLRGKGEVKTIGGG